MINIAIAIGLLAMSGSASADVYRCTAQDGSVEMRDFPCRPHDAAARKIDVRPNVVDMKPNPDVARKLQEFDKKTAERQKTDDERRQRVGATSDAYRRECRSYEEAAARAAAWTASVSAAVRASAATDIEIARRRYYEAGCANPNTAP
jgi:hypothetical protein